ncbi:MAG: superoxide dismutase family protein [Pseudomonadales bacterium]|nr:superoxide dismutase family protein [Pseudomonadales bacterium]
MRTTFLNPIGLSLLVLPVLVACNDSDQVAQSGQRGEPAVQLRIPVDEDNEAIPGNNETQLPNEEVKPRDVIPVEYFQPGEAQPLLALADLEPTDGHYVSGMVAFIESDKAPGTRIVAKLSNAPFGMHGFHIHEHGDCSGAGSAGGHFNPEDQPHGGRMTESSHLGDLANIEEVDTDGRTALDIMDEDLTLRGENSIVGKAVVIHEEPDDLESQPAGDSGERIACGVIENYYVAGR